MKKSVALGLILLLVFSLLAGCATKPATPIRMAALKGPTGLGLAYLTENNAACSLEIYDAPDVVTGKFINGEVDVACVPVNLASVLYNKLQGDVVLLNVNTRGVLYILENDSDIQQVQDLAGKTIYASGQGSTPEYVLNYILKMNGLTDSVTVEYVGEHATLAAMLASGEAEIAMLPEPNVSAVLAKNTDIRIALDLTDEWNSASDTALVQGCTITTRAYYESHEKQLQELMLDYNESVQRVLSDSAAAEKIAELGMLPSAAIAASAIPNCNIVCLTGEEAKRDMSSMLNVLFEANPASVGGALPNEDFYAAF